MSNSELAANSSKRKDENQPGPSRKRPNRRESSDSDDTGPLKIIGLNDDCLDHVFSYLNATELNNVADAHPRLVSAAQEVFKQKYRNHCIKIQESGRVISIHSKFKMVSGEIVYATARSFLGNFGKFISKLELDYKNDSQYDDAHHWREIEGLIFEHCSKTLTRTMFYNCHGNVMEEIQKPFEKVEKLCVKHGFTEPTNFDLSKCFPNIDALILSGTAINSTEQMKGNCSSLRRLEILELELIDGMKENIRHFIKSNPGIIYLYILSSEDKNQLSIDFLEFLSETLNQLRTLYLVNLKFIEVNSLKYINFPQMNKLFLSAVQYPNNTSITCGQLKHLDLRNIPINSKWTDFIMQQQTITSLLWSCDMNIDDLIQVVTGMPNLKILRFRSLLISIDEFIHFLKLCVPLTNLSTIGKICYGGNDNSDLNKITNLVDDDLKRIYDGPAAKPIDIGNANTRFASMEFRRRIN